MLAVVIALLALLPNPASAGCGERRIFDAVSPGLRTAWSKVRNEPDGRLGGNIPAFVSVAPQRYSFNALWGALLADVDVDRSLRVAEFAFAHQLGTGAFEYKLGTNPLGAASDAAFFLSDYGHASLLLREEAHGAAVRAGGTRIAALDKRAPLSIRWLARQSEHLAKDRKAANRVFIFAKALILGGEVAADPFARSTGVDFLRVALSMQAADGTFLESGGFDASYQAVGIYHAVTLLCHLPSSLALERAALTKAVERAATRMLVPIEPTGFISQEGSSRVRSDGTGETVNGKPKSLDPRYAAIALHYAGDLLSMPKFTEAASRVSGYYYKTKR